MGPNPQQPHAGMSTQNKPATAQNPGGRPKLPRASPGELKKKSLDNLQYVLDRACIFIHDGPSSYAVRARRAKKNGVDRVTIERGLEAMSAALKDAQGAVERMYTTREEKVAPKSRVALGGAV